MCSHKCVYWTVKMQLERLSTRCLKTANERHFIKSSPLVRWIWIYVLRRHSVALSIVLSFLWLAWRTQKLQRRWWQKVPRSMREYILRKPVGGFSQICSTGQKVSVPAEAGGWSGNVKNLNCCQIRLQSLIQLLLESSRSLKNSATIIRYFEMNM